MFRMTGALLISAAIALLTGPKLIAYLKKLHFGQTIYELGPAHQQKQGTPVMGGLMMAAGIVSIWFCLWKNLLLCWQMPGMALANAAWSRESSLPLLKTMRMLSHT